MLLDIEDVQIRARLSPLGDDRIRLVLDYPREPRYRDRVMTALSDLLRPTGLTPNKEVENIDERPAA